MKESEQIWFNGEFMPWANARIHVFSHGLHYGSSVFEGIRSYKTEQGPAILCLNEHVERLFNSCKIARMEIPFSFEEIANAIIDAIRLNQLESCYVRPIVFRGMESLNIDPRTCPVEIAIGAIEWGTLLGAEALENGVDVGVSSWRRMAPDTYPAMGKIGGQYVSSQLILMEAVDQGYAEGIALDVNGHVSEGSGENIFVVKGQKIYTPPLSSSILVGVTRQIIKTLARDAGYEVVESVVPRESLYVADEVFFTGTAAEVTPIRSVDRIPVGSGKRGPVTERLQKEFFDITSGKMKDRHNWLTLVNQHVAAAT
jgi:branched-chain amino acid aminotransferase